MIEIAYCCSTLPPNLFALDEVNLAELPITQLIQNEQLLDFMIHNGDEGQHHERTINLSNGYNYHARLTVIAGGTRFVLLRRIEATAE